jgi:hypothetical protein
VPTVEISQITGIRTYKRIWTKTLTAADVAPLGTDISRDTINGEQEMFVSEAKNLRWRTPRAKREAEGGAKHPFGRRETVRINPLANSITPAQFNHHCGRDASRGANTAQVRRWQRLNVTFAHVHT